MDVPWKMIWVWYFAVSFIKEMITYHNDILSGAFEAFWTALLIAIPVIIIMKMVYFIDGKLIHKFL